MRSRRARALRSLVLFADRPTPLTSRGRSSNTQKHAAYPPALGMHGSGPSRRSETGMIDVLFVLYRPRRIHPCGLWHLSVPLSLIMHATTTQKNHPPRNGQEPRGTNTIRIHHYSRRMQNETGTLALLMDGCGWHGTSELRRPRSDNGKETQKERKR